MGGAAPPDRDLAAGNEAKDVALSQIEKRARLKGAGHPVRGLRVGEFLLFSPRACCGSVWWRWRCCFYGSAGSRFGERSSAAYRFHPGLLVHHCGYRRSCGRGIFTLVAKLVWRLGKVRAASYDATEALRAASKALYDVAEPCPRQSRGGDAVKRGGEAGGSEQPIGT